MPEPVVPEILKPRTQTQGLTPPPRSYHVSRHRGLGSEEVWVSGVGAPSYSCIFQRLQSTLGFRVYRFRV